MLRLLAVVLTQRVRTFVTRPLRGALQILLVLALAIVIGRWLSAVPADLVILLSLAVAAAWSRIRLPDVVHQVQRGWLGSLALSASGRRLLIVFLTALPVIAFSLLLGLATAVL
ncbi:MAG: hypothetical protein AAFN78_19650 [Pseudomonadota bacterium]